jgi:hypothetical protein
MLGQNLVKISECIHSVFRKYLKCIFCVKWVVKTVLDLYSLSVEKFIFLQVNIVESS